jgi:hypothetical protein
VNRTGGFTVGSDNEQRTVIRFAMYDHYPVYNSTNTERLNAEFHDFTTCVEVMDENQRRSASGLSPEMMDI